MITRQAHPNTMHSQAATLKGCLGTCNGNLTLSKRTCFSRGQRTHYRRHHLCHMLQNGHRLTQQSHRPSSGCLVQRLPSNMTTSHGRWSHTLVAQQGKGAEASHPQPIGDCVGTLGWHSGENAVRDVLCNGVRWYGCPVDHDARRAPVLAWVDQPLDTGRD